MLPIVKGTAYSLYPSSRIALAATLWRHHRRADLRGWVGARARGARRAAGCRCASRTCSILFSRRAPERVPLAPKPARLGPRRGKRSRIRSDYLELPVAGVPAAAAVHDPITSPARLPGDGHLRRTRLGGVRLVRRVLPAPGLRGDPRRDDRRPVPRPDRPAAGVAVRAPQRGRVRAARADARWRSSLGFEAAFYTPGARPFIAEFGRYAFPAITPLAVLVVASLHAFGRRWVLQAGVGAARGDGGAQLCHASW